VFKLGQYSTKLWQELHRDDTSKQNQTHTMLTYQRSQEQLHTTYMRAYLYTQVALLQQNEGTFALTNIAFDRVPLQPFIPNIPSWPQQNNNITKHKITK